MQKTRKISDLLGSGSARLSDLKARLTARSGVLEHVRAALPQRLAGRVASAGIEHGRLTVGVAGAAWAARLRYESDGLRKRVGGSLQTAIHTVRIRVLPGQP
jgi:hypothetical protein